VFHLPGSSFVAVLVFNWLIASASLVALVKWPNTRWDKTEMFFLFVSIVVIFITSCALAGKVGPCPFRFSLGAL
jgi:hypothetical protein